MSRSPRRASASGQCCRSLPPGGPRPSPRSTSTAVPAPSTRAPRPSPPCSPHRSPSRLADHRSSLPPERSSKRPSATPTTTPRSRWRPGCSSAVRTAPASKPKGCSDKPPPRTNKPSCRSPNASSISTAAHADPVLEFPRIAHGWAWTDHAAAATWSMGPRSPNEVAAGRPLGRFDVLAEAVRREVADAGVTVTALMPGPTDTEFFERAGLEGSKIDEGHKGDPADVARDGFEALMAGKDHVVAGSARNRMQAGLGKVLPEKITAVVHGVQSKPPGTE